MSNIARIPTRFLKTALAAAAVAAAVAGCSSDKWGFPYRAPVQQGNWITQEQVALLQPGMTREQVRFALGSPTLTSVLHADRWDYPYYFKPGYGEPSERKFTVWFENDLLARWEGDKQPELQPFQLDAEGKPQEKVDEQIDADTARQNAETPQSTQPADAAQLPALGTPPGGALPAENIDTAVSQPVPDAGADVTTPQSTPDASGDAAAPQSTPDAGSGITAPGMSGSEMSDPGAASQSEPAAPRRRELRINQPSDSVNSINQPTDSAQPLR